MATKRKLTCDICDLAFKTRKEFKIHNHDEPPKEMQNQDNDNSMLSAVKSVTVVNGEVVEFIGETVDIKEILEIAPLKKKTKLVLDNNESHECQSCKKTFLSENDLLAHKFKSTFLPCENRKSKDLDCHQCHKHFPNPEDLVMHSAKEHPLQEYKRHCVNNDDFEENAISIKCQECQEVFRNRKSWFLHVLKKHEVEGKEWKCDKCSSTSFRFPSSLIMHDSVMHKSNNSLFMNSQPNLNCIKCDKSFNKKPHFVKHVLFIHEKQGTGSAEELKCDACHTNFLSRSELKDHNLANHEEVGKFECDDCDKEFRYQTSLKMHANLWHGQKSIMACLKCGKDFYNPETTMIRNREELKRHFQEKHETIQQFPCELCNQTFKNGLQYVKHTFQVHRVTKCKLCDAELNPGKDMQPMFRHYRDLHNWSERFWCKYCIVVLPDQDKVDEHLKKHRLWKDMQRISKSSFAGSLDSTVAALKSHTSSSWKKTAAKTVSNPNFPPGTICCQPCGLMFKNKDGLSSHLLNSKAHQ